MKELILEFMPYSVGLVHASVCTSLPPEEAEKRLNETHPTGISSAWKLSDNSRFASGHPNPCDCPDHKGFKHYLFDC